MPRKQRPPLPLQEQAARIRAARLANKSTIEEAPSAESFLQSPPDYVKLDSLDERIKMILHLSECKRKKPNTMLFFVMYDIESNKVRRMIGKYLEKNGCTRIQKSIFLANTSMEIYNQIKNDLTEVQATYENNDSIIVLPVSTDFINMMKIIGQEISVDIITQSKTILFF